MMSFRTLKSMAFGLLATSLMLIATSGEAADPSITRTPGVGGVVGSIGSSVSVPACHFNMYTGVGAARSDDGSTFDIDDDRVESVVQQSMSTECLDVALTNMGCVGDISLISDVVDHESSSVIVAAQTSGGGRVDGAGGGSTPTVGSGTSANYTVTAPPGGLSGSEVIVFHGFVNVLKHEGVGPVMATAGATGPGVTLTVVTGGSGGSYELAGTVVDVLSGTTTTYEQDGVGGVLVPFSEVVSGSISVSSNASVSIIGGLTGGATATGEANAYIFGQLTVHDASSFPTMSYVTVSSQ